MAHASFIALWLLHAAFADTVAVESSPRAPELEQALLDACSAALGAQDRCRDAGVPGDGVAEAPTWFVRVEWAENGRHARIAFRLHDSAGELTELREVAFAEADSGEQRHKAVGLIIAAYVVQQAEAREQDAKRKAEAPEPEPPPSPAAESDSDSDSDSASESETESEAPPRVAPLWALDVAFYAGPGLRQGRPRLGLLVRGLIWPLSLPLAAVGGIRLAQRFGDPTVRWLTGSLGVAASLLPPSVAGGLELRAEAAVQNARAEAQAPMGATGREHGALWRFGALIGLDVSIELAAHFGLVAGAELALLQPRLHLDIGGSEAGVDPAVSWAGMLGVRVTR